MEPPIQTEYLRSGGATTLTFMDEGARAVISLFMRSAMPGNMVVPVRITFVSHVLHVQLQQTASSLSGKGVRSIAFQIHTLMSRCDKTHGLFRHHVCT